MLISWFLVLSSLPPTSLLTGVKYNKMADVFHAKGYHASTPSQLCSILTTVTKAFTNERSAPVIINVEIDPSSARKPQVLEEDNTIKSNTLYEQV